MRRAHGSLSTAVRGLHHHAQTSGVYSTAPSRLSGLTPTIDTAQLASTSRIATPTQYAHLSSQLPSDYFRHTRPEREQRKPGPGSASPEPSKHTHPVSDREFDVRLGRAVSLLRATLDDFMRIGLVDYDSTNVANSASSSGIGVPSLDRLGLGAIVQAFAARMSAKEKHRAEIPPFLRTDSDCPVYHPHIVFKFRPPIPTPSSSMSEPSDSSADSTLVTFSGRTMYFGSAHILRHALSALFSSTNICIERAHLQRGHDEAHAHDGSVGTAATQSSQSQAGIPSRRQATLVLRLTFSGVVRVTQQMHEYTVIFRYQFDPDTGMIIEHKVDRIEPAPGKKIWAGLSAAFARLAGFQPQPEPQRPGAASGCHMTSTMPERADARSHPAYIPLMLTQRAKPSKKTASIATAVGVDWQKRRAFATQSQPAAASSSARNRAATAHGANSAALPSPSSNTLATSNSFFSRPRDADAMPGPSLASILVGRSASKPSGKKLAALQRWAPASDDPSIVPGAALQQLSPSAAAAMSHYRPTTGLTARSWARVVAGLSKSNLTVLVTLTAMAGYALCPTTLAVASSPMGPVATLLALTMGTALCSAAANTINQLREIPYDAQMARTRNRVLPSRTVSPLQAATFAGLASTAGVSLLATLNPLTAVLGLGNIVLYAFVYTPMKRTSIANTWLGAVVGALPPLMGWAACTGTLHLATDCPAWCLAALLFAWQFPHFNSLSHNLSSEYARGGYRMMSVLDPALNRRTSLRYSLALLPICSVALPLSGAVLAVPYALASMPANLVLIHAAWKFWHKGDAASARWCFWVSLVHLPAVMILAMALKTGLWEGVAQSLGMGAAASDDDLD
ncbi:unnamed protein product [Parajaminaea phylloscopi]